MPTLTLNPLTQDFQQFSAQFGTFLVNQPIWKGQLTTQTSQTLIELISSVGTFNQSRITRTAEDSFSETAQSDDAIRSITQMQGLRMSRKLPADMTATLTSTINVTLNPLSQFTSGGQYYFNREQINLVANVPFDVVLHQGQVQTFAMNGLGSPRQTFISDEDSFTVSDQDVRVFVNNSLIDKSFGHLWNFRNLPAYGDITTSDGRLLVVFGSEQFGTVPKVTDTVVIQYPVTNGADGASQVLLNKPVSIDGLPELTGIVTSNPQGGGNEQPVQTYKNLSSGAFGTYESAVTKSQYLATVGVYPGVIDSVTQAQRDINPLALEWMNVMRVSALTLSPWSQDQKRAYIDYLQKVTMYAPRFVWQDAIAVPRTVSLTAFCFNSAVLSKVKADIELAVQQLFAPRPGLLLTNFYNSDLDGVAKTAGQGAVSYVVIDEPTEPMIVTLPLSPLLQYEIIAGAGTLSELVYAYAVSTVNTAGEEGTPANWIFPQVIGPGNVYGIKLDWKALPDVQTYKLWGRKAGSIGLIATFTATDPLTFTDNGSIVPTGGPPNLIVAVPIRYNSLASLTVNVEFAERQQRIDGTIPTRGLT
jgi:hypothetical protein